MLVESFEIKLEVRSHTYQKPYPPYFDATTLFILKVIRFLSLLNLTVKIVESHLTPARQKHDESISNMSKDLEMLKPFL